jgi:hypothetical protein
MILIGLALPSLVGAKSVASLSRSLSVIRQNAILLDLYCASNKSIYPIGVPRAKNGADDHWALMMVSTGLASHQRDLDPEWEPAHPDYRWSGVDYQMSVAMAYNPDLMARGQTVFWADDDPNGWPVSPIRTDMVTFPSDKGILWKTKVTWGPEQGPWCCLPRAGAGPIAFADTSAASFRWDQLRGATDPKENGVGWPISTTWDGCRGRDR